MEKIELPHPGWPAPQLVQWLRMQGGVSEEGLAEIEHLGFNGELWYAATAADFRNEEMGLEEADVARLLELKDIHERLLNAGRDNAEMSNHVENTTAEGYAQADTSSLASIPPSMSAIVENLAVVLAKIERSACDRASELSAEEKEANLATAPVRLVAVSKLKPVEDLQKAYEAGQRYFGENYVQELVDKVPQMAPDVQWHFIGHLQSNKVSQLIKGCPYLACLETIDSEKLAKAVNKEWLKEERGRKLRVMIQVNSSGEESKNGVAEEEVVPLARVISTECEGLELAGLMTIGAPDYSGCRTEDFETVHGCRRAVADALGVDIATLEMSMGMSNDYETAIKQGSTSVRVGSSIFGARPAKT